MSYDGSDEQQVRADNIIMAFLTARVDRSRKARRAWREAEAREFAAWQAGADGLDFGDWEDDWEDEE